MQKVIIPIWHGIAPTNKADDYLDFLFTRGTKDYESTPGNLSIHIGGATYIQLQHGIPWKVLRSLPVRMLKKHIITRKTKAFYWSLNPK